MELGPCGPSGARLQPECSCLFLLVCLLLVYVISSMQIKNHWKTWQSCWTYLTNISDLNFLYSISYGHLAVRPPNENERIRDDENEDGKDKKKKRN